jgi:ATP-dependent protease ClpP protease subunit
MINASLLASVPARIINAASDPQWKIFTNVSDEGVDVRLDGFVGDEYTQSDAASIREILRANRGKLATLRVSSGGGLAFDGINIHNAFAEHDGPTVGIIESLAASAAAVAVLGTQTIKMNANATFMIHESIGDVRGHAWEIRELLQWMDRLDTAIAETLSDKTGLPLATVVNHLKGNGDGTVFNAQEALKAGYVHEIIGKKEAGKSKPKNSVSADRLRMWKRALTR